MSGIYSQTALLARALLAGGVVHVAGHTEGKQASTANREPEPPTAPDSRQVRRAKERAAKKGRE